MGWGHEPVRGLRGAFSGTARWQRCGPRPISSPAAEPGCAAAAGGRAGRTPTTSTRRPGRHLRRVAGHPPRPCGRSGAGHGARLCRRWGPSAPVPGRPRGGRGHAPRAAAPRRSLGAEPIRVQLRCRRGTARGIWSLAAAATSWATALAPSSSPSPRTRSSAGRNEGRGSVGTHDRAGWQRGRCAVPGSRPTGRRDAPATQGRALRHPWGPRRRRRPRRAFGARHRRLQLPHATAKAP